MRNLSLSSRNENSRDAIVPDMHITRLDELYAQFKANIAMVEEQFAVADILNGLKNTEAEKDIFRSQVVFLDSALDYYMHGLGIYAMEQMYRGNWDKTDGYKNLKVPIDKVMYAIEHPEDSLWIDAVIISHHEAKTYMSSSEIKGQFTLIAGNGLFKQVADLMYYDINSRESTEKKLASKLDELFKRRNRIVHQADRDHSIGEKFDICRNDVVTFISTVVEFVDKTHTLLTGKTQDIV